MLLLVLEKLCHIDFRVFRMNVTTIYMLLFAENMICIWDMEHASVFVNLVCTWYIDLWAAIVLRADCIRHVELIRVGVSSAY